MTATLLLLVLFIGTQLLMKCLFGQVLLGVVSHLLLLCSVLDLQQQAEKHPSQA
jgi:hypothetical protein